MTIKQPNDIKRKRIHCQILLENKQNNMRVPSNNHANLETDYIILS